MKNKWVITFLCALTIAVSALPQAYAASNPPVAIQPFWLNVDSLRTSLTFSGNTAVCGARIIAVPGVVSITATALLERKNANGTYTEVKTWTGLSSSTTSLIFDGSHNVTTGYTYKLTITANVTRSGSTEIVSGWVESKP